VYSLAVGAGGKGINQTGGASWFGSSTQLLARGGAGGSLVGGAGGNCTIDASLTSSGCGVGGR